MEQHYSFIIPVYNRPDEIRELLESISKQNFPEVFEVVIVEDGSTIPSKEVITDFNNKLHIQYLEKPNTGPGDSRNYGMQNANGNYFLILDSDVVLPSNYLKEVDNYLQRHFVHCFGGPDTAEQSFTKIQKAINYAMTSFFTTGGIRGNKNMINNFQPRSFNMGLSKEAFLKSGGFGKIHPGEDPDLALRLKKLGYKTPFLPKAFVYHKRRISWRNFLQQVYKFGATRPILIYWHPESAKITYWFPALFCIGFLLSLGFYFLGISAFLMMYLAYFIGIFIDASLVNRNPITGFLAVWASLVQFIGYGFGFCRSSFYLRILKEDPEKRFPKLFFTNDK